MRPVHRRSKQRSLGGVEQLEDRTLFSASLTQAASPGGVTIEQFYVSGQISSTSNFTAKTTTTVDLTGNAPSLSLPVGDYFRFGIADLIANNPNPVSGSPWDKQNIANGNPAAVPYLGLAGIGYVIGSTDTTATELAAVQVGASIGPDPQTGKPAYDTTETFNSALTNVAAENPGDTEPGDGTVGNPLSIYMFTVNLASFNAQSPSGNPQLGYFSTSSQSPTAANATTFFTRLAYHAVSSGQVKLTPTAPLNQLQYWTATSNGSVGATSGGGHTITADPQYVVSDLKPNDKLVGMPALTIDIGPAPAAAKLAFSTQPTGGGGPGQTLLPMAVSVENGLGGVATGDTSSVTLSILSGPAGGTFAAGSTTTVKAVNGVATFGSVALTAAGNYVLKATDGTLTAASSSSFPVTATRTTIVVDDKQATLVGTWTSSTYTPGYYGTDYLTDGDAGHGKTATFTPDITTAGFYHVYGYWTAAANRAKDTIFTVQSASGTGVVTENQQINGGEFNLLGTYYFNAGTGGNVVISDSAVYGYVIADAVEFVPAASTIVDNTQATLTGTWNVSTHLPGYYGSNYLSDGGVLYGHTATYTPTLTAGTYDIFGIWTADSNRATDALFTVNSASGSSPLLENQRLNGEQWVLLGTYTFNAGSGGNVVISDFGANGYVIADAVAFVQV